MAIFEGAFQNIVGYTSGEVGELAEDFLIRLAISPDIGYRNNYPWTDTSEKVRLALNIDYSVDKPCEGSDGPFLQGAATTVYTRRIDWTLFVHSPFLTLTRSDAYDTYDVFGLGWDTAINYRQYTGSELRALDSIDLGKLTSIGQEVSTTSFGLDTPAPRNYTFIAVRELETDAGFPMDSFPTGPRSYFTGLKHYRELNEAPVLCTPPSDNYNSIVGVDHEFATSAQVPYNGPVRTLDDFGTLTMDDGEQYEPLLFSVIINPLSDIEEANFPEVLLRRLTKRTRTITLRFRQTATSVIAYDDDCVPDSSDPDSCPDSQFVREYAQSISILLTAFDGSTQIGNEGVFEELWRPVWPDELYAGETNDKSHPVPSLSGVVTYNEESASESLTLTIKQFTLNAVVCCPDGKLSYQLPDEPITVGQVTLNRLSLPPIVVAGKEQQIIGFRDAVSDGEGVVTTTALVREIR